MTWMLSMMPAISMTHVMTVSVMLLLSYFCEAVLCDNAFVSSLEAFPVQ